MFLSMFLWFALMPKKLHPLVQDLLDLECKLTDSVVDISDNRINGGVDCVGCGGGVDIEYEGRINSGTKITVSVSQNEVINGTDEGLDLIFVGCCLGGFNVHGEDNDEINDVRGAAV